MIRITTQTRTDDTGTYVTVHADGPIPCGTLKMTPAEASELAARIDAVETETAITPDVAAHVLWHYREPGGMEPGNFTWHLIEALVRADREHTLRMSAVYPAHVRAVHLASRVDDGIRQLQVIAAPHLITPPVGA